MTTTPQHLSPVTSMPVVPPAHAVDRRTAASVLAAAFQDDPIFAWLLPDAAHRARHTRVFFELVTDAVVPYGRSWSSNDGSGAALWVPSGEPSLPPSAEERLEAFVAGAGHETASRLIALVAVMEEHHPASPHEYLWFLGVAPALQGRGAGGALLRAGLAAADRSGLPSYLEATSPRNKRLYERHGFVASAPVGTGDSPPMWPMRRAAGQEAPTRR